jgi:uncharacterized protein (TIGR02145 family)
MRTDVINSLLIFIISYIFISSCNQKNINNENNSKIIKYESVVICKQIWMTKNLDVDHYRNGDSIPEVKDYNEWANLSIGAWCYYNNDSLMSSIYGKLYNWYAVNDPRGLAPKGWYIPSDLEFSELVKCLGGDTIAGGKLKEVGSLHWDNPNEGATNTSSFTALPGGIRNEVGGFYWKGYSCSLWSSTLFDKSHAYVYGLFSTDDAIVRGYSIKLYGLSVRCIKEN